MIINNIDLKERGYTHCICNTVLPHSWQFKPSRCLQHHQSRGNSAVKVRFANENISLREASHSFCQLPAHCLPSAFLEAAECNHILRISEKKCKCLPECTFLYQGFLGSSHTLLRNEIELRLSANWHDICLPWYSSFFFSSGCSQLAVCLCHYNSSVSTSGPCFSFSFVLFCFHASASLRMRHSFLAAGLTSNDSHLSLWCASCWMCKNCFQEALLLYQILVMRQEGRADCQGKKNIICWWA